MHVVHKNFYRFFIPDHEKAPGQGPGAGLCSAVQGGAGGASGAGLGPKLARYAGL